MTKICTGNPREFESEEIDNFVAFTMAGGEVSPKGLRERVLKASCLAFLRENGCLLGVAGLKKPASSYRGKVEKNSGVKIRAESFPYELGWVFILPSARGRKLSFPLCEPLVTAAAGKGVFATSRTDNVGMHKTLENLGFATKDSEWPSNENDGTLKLFLKPAI